MSCLDTENGRVFKCDDCSEEHETGIKNFYDAWNDAQVHGVRYYGNDYHRCDSCAEDLWREVSYGGYSF